MFAHYDRRVEPVYDPGGGTYRLKHDPESHWPPSTTLVLAVASLTGTEPGEMLPLHGAVDPAILDRYVGSGSGTGGANVSFEFHGYEVTVRADGGIELAPEDGREA